MKITTPQMLALAIRDVRKSRSLTQKQIADLVGMKQATVSGFETEPASSKVDTLFRILAALELEIQVVPRGTGVNEWKEEW